MRQKNHDVDKTENAHRQICGMIRAVAQAERCDSPSAVRRNPTSPCQAEVAAAAAPKEQSVFTKSGDVFVLLLRFLHVEALLHELDEAGELLAALHQRVRDTLAQGRVQVPRLQRFCELVTSVLHLTLPCGPLICGKL